MNEISPTGVSDYREELMTSITSARELTAKTIQRAQARYKHQYDRHARKATLRIGDWILVRFPQDETGWYRKLSRPWHGPYRIVEKSDPDVVCSKVYFPQDRQLRIHLSRVCLCPQDFPAGYFCYGGKRKGLGRPLKWVDRLLSKGPSGRHTQRESPTDSNTTHANSPTPRPAVPTGDQEEVEADSVHTCRRDCNSESRSDHSDQSVAAKDDDLSIRDEVEAACDSENGEDNLGPGQGDGQEENCEDSGETRGNFTPGPDNSPAKPPLVPHSHPTSENTGRRKYKVDSAPRHQRLRREVKPPDRLIANCYSTSTHLLQGENTASETYVHAVTASGGVHMDNGLGPKRNTLSIQAQQQESPATAINSDDPNAPLPRSQEMAETSPSSDFPLRGG